MSEKTLCRLAHMTVVEPLVSNWTDWPSVFATVPASLHLLRYQIPLWHTTSAWQKTYLNSIAGSSSTRRNMGMCYINSTFRLPEMGGLIRLQSKEPKDDR